MHETKPIFDLQNTIETDSISLIVSETIFTSKNEFSIEFANHSVQEEIYIKLLEAEYDVANGNVTDSGEVFVDLRKQYSY